jgi:hypothetical protein
MLISCQLGRVRIPLQFDIGFGDFIKPEIRFPKWSAPLDYEDIPLATYPMETVVAEKSGAAVSLGINNSRLKDFYDLHWLQSHLIFDGKVLTEAGTNTFARRSTIISDAIPVAFTTAFSSDAQKIEQWSAFLRKGNLSVIELPLVVKAISNFVLPVLLKQVSDLVWTPSGHWKAISAGS